MAAPIAGSWTGEKISGTLLGGEQRFDRGSQRGVVLAFTIERVRRTRRAAIR